MRKYKYTHKLDKHEYKICCYGNCYVFGMYVYFGTGSYLTVL